jgi:hypothetical protein
MSDDKDAGSDPQGKGDEWSAAMDEQAGGAGARTVELDELIFDQGRRRRSRAVTGSDSCYATSALLH